MKSVRYGARRNRKAPGLDMAPLMDMIFILLIFFIVTTSFVKESGVVINRPIAKSAVSQEKTNMVIGITQAGHVYIEGQVVDVRSVRAKMERFLAETPGGSVVIAADTQSYSGKVIQVLDACRLAGIKNLSVATRKKDD